MAKVSICIPCFNNAPEVERLLRSVYEQDHTDFEIDISDDSTDEETAGLIGRIRKGLCWSDPPLAQRAKEHAKGGLYYVHNKEPLGHIFNWNAAIRMAGGEYIKVMFSDDWFTDSTSLSGFVKMLDDTPEASLAFCGSRQVMLDGAGAEGLRHVEQSHRKASYDRYASKEFIQALRQDHRNLFLGNQIGAPSAVIYRRGSRLALFDEQSNWASDMFLFFELLQDDPCFVYTKRPLVSIGVHEHQYTESFGERDQRIYDDHRYMYTKYRLQESRACREYFTEKFIIKYHKGYREARALGIDGRTYWKKWLAEQQATVRCFIDARRHQGTLGKGF